MRLILTLANNVGVVAVETAGDPVTDLSSYEFDMTLKT